MEKWKDIPNYPGYEVSDSGYIRSYWKRAKKQGFVYELSTDPQRILALNVDGSGYYTVNLSQNHKCYSKRVHVLVLTAFVGEPPIGYECRHLDGNKLNNNIDNLCWGTRLENVNDCINHCRKIDPPHLKGESHPRSKLTEFDVGRIKMYSFMGLSTRRIAALYDVSQSAIHGIVSGITWKHLKVTG